MVRREGTRFGVATSHSMRRLPFPYQQIYGQQSIVIDAKLGETANKKQAKASVKKQLQKGSFDSNEPSIKHIKFSLNKCKRWEVIEDIVEDGFICENQSIVVEEHMFPRGATSRFCTGVFDSMGENTKLPKEKYGRRKDLLKEETKEEMEVVEDANFGKKNSKRSKKRKSEDEMENGSKVPMTTVKYDVSLAAPRQTYQVYCSRFISNPENGTPKKRRNGKKRTKCNVNDALSDGFWRMESDDYLEYDEEEDEDYYLEADTEFDSNYNVDFESLLHSTHTAGPKVYHRNRNTVMYPEESEDRKEHIIQIDESDVFPYVFTNPSDVVRTAKQMERQMRRRQRKQDKERKEKEKKDAKENIDAVIENATPATVVQEVFEKPFESYFVKSDDISEGSLQGKFGTCYFEGLSMPRRFGLNITESIIDQLKSGLSNGSNEVVSLLRHTDHHVYMIVECALDSCLARGVEEVHVKVCGVREDKAVLDGAVANLDSNDILHLQETVAASVSKMPADSYLTDNSVTSIATNTALNVGTVKSALGWTYDVTNVNKASEKVLDTFTTQDDETDESSGASNDCDSCGICFQEFDETCLGTAMLACSHWFCDECWRGHLMARVEQGDTNITCPSYGCKVAVDKVTLMSLLPSRLYARHHNDKANVALMRQPDLKWCPSPRCGRLLRVATTRSNQSVTNTNQIEPVQTSAVFPVSCECGMIWCSECKQEAHWPATCEQAKEYWKKAQEALGRRQAEEVKLQAKKCPVCNYPIEKYYGCNHMVCKCGASFCWECGQKFSDDHYYCMIRRKLAFKKYVLKPEDLVAKSAVDLAVIHHKKRTKFACHRRTRNAKKLAIKLAQSSSSDSESDETASLGSSTTSLKTVGSGSRNLQLQNFLHVLTDVANFLSEAEFVLEHLEILLSSSSPSNQRRVLSQHKSRLIFITDNLHKVVDGDAKIDMSRIEHFLHCGKSCLRFIAVAATQLNNINSTTTEE